jgi:hypothetical protein
VRVDGPGVPFPIDLRISSDAGRYMITGLQTGREFEPREITSQMLRQIKLREILASLLADYDPDAPPTWTLPSAITIVADENASSLWRAQRRPRGPDDATLRAFAHTYLTELARQPRRAMSVAAREHNISRATANRWAEMCRELGYLPAKGEK